MDLENRGSKATLHSGRNVHRGIRRESFALATYKVKQEVPADSIILDQMGCDVGGCVGGKGHQEVCSRYCQGATCNNESRESG